MYIGKRIKEIRKAQKMTLQELSEKSGVQIATLSRMENLKMTGTLESHLSIAKALGVELTDLYTDIIREDSTIDVMSDQSEKDVFVHSDHSSYEILTHKVLSKRMMPILLKIESKGKTNVEQNPFGTEKFIYVLEGTIEALVAGKSYPLSSNGSLYFDASLEHCFVNTGKDLARIICITTPVAL